MDGVQGTTRYWCHQCMEMITPVREPELKCPSCDNGFVEEMDGRGFEPAQNMRSERSSLSTLAPLLLGMMGSSTSRSRRSRMRRAFMDSEEEEDERRSRMRRALRSDDQDEERRLRMRRALRDDSDSDDDRRMRLLSALRDDDDERRSRIRRELRGDDDDDVSDHELEDSISRLRRNTSMLRLLQVLHGDDLDRERDRDRERGRTERERERARGRRGERTESLILINSNNEAIIVQGTFGPDDSQDDTSNTRTGASLGDYFLGPGLDLLLQRLAESDLNRYGTPPAKKEAVDALPTVKISEVLSCSVCLEDFEMGLEVKEMPCQHKFHCSCILPWLELHSSCPICRFQLPTDESKTHQSASRSGVENSAGGSADTAVAGNADTAVVENSAGGSAATAVVENSTRGSADTAVVENSAGGSADTAVARKSAGGSADTAVARKSAEGSADTAVERKSAGGSADTAVAQKSAGWSADNAVVENNAGGSADTTGTKRATTNRESSNRPRNGPAWPFSMLFPSSDSRNNVSSSSDPSSSSSSSAGSNTRSSGK